MPLCSFPACPGGRPCPDLATLGRAGPKGPALGGAARLSLRLNLSTRSLSPSIPTGIPTRLRSRITRISAAGASTPGGGVAERPTITPSLTPTKDASRSRSSPYRVLLHNDDTNKREYVVSVLMKVVDGLGVDEAVNVMNVRFERRRDGRDGTGEREPFPSHPGLTLLSLSLLFHRRPTSTAKPPSSRAASPTRRSTARGCAAMG